MSDFIKGEDLILYVYDTSAYKPIACLTSNSLTRSKQVIESKTKCDPGLVIKTAGSSSYELSFEGIYIDTISGTGETTKASHDTLMDIFDLTANQTWKLDSGLIDTLAYYGEGIFTSLDLKAGSGDELATFSGSISGSGEIVTVDPEAS